MCAGLSRRSVMAGCVATAAMASFGRASAQSYGLMCSYAGGRFGEGLAPATGYAVYEINAIQRATGYFAPMAIYLGGVPNASATIISGQLSVIYNPDFLNNLFMCNRFAATTVLAHEVGHHANIDTSWQRQNYTHSYTRELGADWFSGFAMRRMGIALGDAQSGIMCTFGAFSPDGASHPGSQRRLQAITDGWSAAAY